jgi:hypothetical protein
VRELRCWLGQLSERVLHQATPDGSLRTIATELATLGHVGPSGLPYHAGSIRHMLAS